MGIGHVENVVLEGGMVVISETAAVSVADDKVDMGDGETLVVALEWFAGGCWHRPTHAATCGGDEACNTFCRLHTHLVRG